MRALVDWWNVAIFCLPQEMNMAEASSVAIRFSDRMHNLGRNLAIAGALCAAIEMGERNGSELYWHARRVWCPNLDGKAFP